MHKHQEAMFVFTLAIVKVFDKTQFACVRTDQERALAPETFWWKRELEPTSNTKMLTLSKRKLQK